MTPIQRLFQFMSNISERAYCAGWMRDFEFELWPRLVSGSPQIGSTTLSEEELRQLRELTVETGGWISYGEHPVFVPIDQWKDAYERWLARVDSSRIHEDLQKTCGGIDSPD